MASGKEIRTQIASIQNTQKITSAMEMVAASKMKKAQGRMHASRPYAEKAEIIIGNLGHAHTESSHPYMKTHESVDCVGLIVVSSDRGLCGGLNTNLFRTLLKTIVDFQERNVSVKICTIGKKARNFFKGLGLNVVSAAADLGDSPVYENVTAAISVLLNDIESGEAQELWLAHNTFVNAITQTPLLHRLTPIVPSNNTKREFHWDYLYEPESKEVLDALLSRFIEAKIYQGLVENIASEQSARMIAMKSATDNAGDMIKDLQLVYNKTRQAAITQEISEIVSGAAAV